MTKRWTRPRFRRSRWHQGGGLPVRPAAGAAGHAGGGPAGQGPAVGRQHAVAGDPVRRAAGAAGRPEGQRRHHPARLPEPGPAASGASPISFILMDDPEHARLRRMVTAPFAIKRVEAMRPAVQKIVDDLIDDMLAGPKPVDLVEAFALPVPSLVICELLGVPYADHDFFQDNSKTIIKRERDARAAVGRPRPAGRLPGRAGGREARRPRRRPALPAGRAGQGRRADPAARPPRWACCC